MPIEPKGLNSAFHSVFYRLPKLWEKIEICLFLPPFLFFLFFFNNSWYARPCTGAGIVGDES